jgi:hypothetical protein
VTPQELRVLAVQKVHELGPIPLDRHRRETWCMERHGAAVMLARLAASDAALLRRATLETTDECSNQSVVALLLDAALECCQGAHASVAAGGGDLARSRAHG